MLRKNLLRVALPTFALILIILTACVPTGDQQEVEVTRYQVLEVPIVETRLVEVTREVEVVQEVEVEVTREVEVVIQPTPRSAPGTPDNPFQIIFIPSFPKSLIDVRGGFFIEDLEANTGFSFEIIVPEEEQDITALICSNPMTTIAMLTSKQYVEVREVCDVVPAVAATRFGAPYELGMFVSRTSSVINVFEDIAYKKIAIPSLKDNATYRVFAKEIAEGNLPGVQFVEYGTSTSALIALLNKEVDIASADFNPPIMPKDSDAWRYGEDSPEIWKQLVVAPRRDPIGFIEVAGGPEFGGYRIRDSRASIFDDHPEVFEETKILILSNPYPNETIVFGQGFPISAYNPILNSILSHANSEVCAQSMCASDFYQWDGVQLVNDDFFDIVRELNGND